METGIIGCLGDRLTPFRKTLMKLLKHRCPECDFTSLAPLAAISAGDAGIWQCERCNRAYSINIEFRSISSELLQRKRNEILPVDESESVESANLEDTDALRGENIERRLLEISQETDRLQQLVQDLEEETERLKREKDSL